MSLMNPLSCPSFDKVINNMYINKASEPTVVTLLDVRNMYKTLDVTHIPWALTRWYLALPLMSSLTSRDTSSGEDTGRCP